MLSPRFFPSVSRCVALTCMCAALGASGLQAQTVYRVVGPDGHVTFSDKPSVTPASKVITTDTAATTPTAAGALPFELRQVMGKYPVTLYTSNACAPCDGGRSFLRDRGIPFTEKTVSTAKDAQALQSLSGNSSLPFLSIGAQHVEGYSSSQWAQYLNAAGYPDRSKLPSSYRAPAATPLTTPDPVATAPESTEASQPTTTDPATPRKNKNNPTGIQF